MNELEVVFFPTTVATTLFDCVASRYFLCSISYRLEFVHSDSL